MVDGVLFDDWNGDIKDHVSYQYSSCSMERSLRHPEDSWTHIINQVDNLRYVRMTLGHAMDAWPAWNGRWERGPGYPGINQNPVSIAAKLTGLIRCFG